MVKGQMENALNAKKAELVSKVKELKLKGTAQASLCQKNKELKYVNVLIQIVGQFANDTNITVGEEFDQVINGARADNSSAQVMMLKDQNTELLKRLAELEAKMK